MPLGLVAAGTKALGGSRFSLVNVLPVALLMGLIAALILSGAYSGGPPDIKRAISELSPSEAGTIVGIVFVVSLLLLPFNTWMVQILEGYWGSNSVAYVLSAFPKQRHVRRMIFAQFDAKLAHADRASDPTLLTVVAHARKQARLAYRRDRARAILARYPLDTSRVLPTTLGNVLRRGEDVAGGRYGLDSMTVYPRLYPSLSPQLAPVVRRQLDIINTTAALSVAFGTATVAAAPLLVSQALSVWSLVPVALAAASLLAYRGASLASATHSRLLATVIDLHRFDLLTALHLPLPETMRDEYILNREISRFLDGPVEAHRAFSPQNQRYEHSGTAAQDRKAANGQQEA